MLFERIVQEALLLAVMGLMAALVVRRFRRCADWIARAHLPSGLLEPGRAMLIGAVAGAGRAVLHAAVLALRGGQLTPFEPPSMVAYFAIGLGLVGLVRRSTPGHTGAEALSGAVLGAVAGAALGWLPVVLTTYDRQIESTVTALAVAGLGAIGWLRVRQMPAVRRVIRTASDYPDARGVLVLSVFAGVLLATVLVPTGIAAPRLLVAEAGLVLGAVLMGQTRRGGAALRRAWARARGLGERARTETDRRRLTPALVGIAAGISTNPAYFWTAMSGFLVEDMALPEGAAGGLNGWAFAGLAAGTLLVAPLARRWDERRLLVWLTLLGGEAMALLALLPGLAVMQGATFAAASMALASSIALPPLLAGTDSRARTSGLYARSWMLTVAVLLTLEPLAAGWVGWQAVALGQAGLMVLVTPLMLLPQSRARARDRRSPIAIWVATFRMLGERRMWNFAAVYFLSGGLYGVFNAIYAPILGSAGIAEAAWIPGLALFVAAFGAKWWGELSHGRGRAGLVVAALITAAPFIALAPLAFADVVALSGLGLVLVLTLQNLGVEIGTTGTTVVGPAALLDDERGQEENALANGAKFGGMAGLGGLAAWLLDGHSLASSLGRPAALGAGAGLLLVLLSATVPLRHGGRPRGGRHAARAGGGYGGGAPARVAGGIAARQWPAVAAGQGISGGCCHSSKTGRRGVKRLQRPRGLGRNHSLAGAG